MGSGRSDRAVPGSEGYEGHRTYVSRVSPECISINTTDVPKDVA